MSQQWTFGQKIALGFTATVLMTGLISLIASLSLNSAVASKDHVIEYNAQNLIEAAKLETAAESKTSNGRAYLLTGDARTLEGMRQSRQVFKTTLENLRTTADDQNVKALLDRVEQAESEQQAALERTIALRKNRADISATSRSFEELVLPRYFQLSTAMNQFVQHEKRALTSGQVASTEAASRAGMTLLLMA